ncbi:MAG: ABC transporter permease [Caldisericum sp.]|jgi:ABC-type dipeptide/oligopeptide/nickel transport system permease subunit|nr:ABC transporter permease [Caldisericum sp.]
MEEEIQLHETFLSESLKSLKKNKSAIFGLVIVLILIITAVLAPIISPHNPIEQDLYNNLKPGFWAGNTKNILGTDEFGRDILSRIIYGARVSLSVGVIAVIIGVLLGGLAGLFSGFYGGWIDNLIMRTTDIMFALPSILLAIVIVSVLGRGLSKAMIAIGITYAPQIARVVRSETIVVKGSEYIEAAKAIGSPRLRTLRVHVLPNVLSVIIVYTTLSIGSAILDAAALGFLGLGAQPPTPEWGAMLANSNHYITGGYWWLATFPGIAILISVLGFNLLGDGLRDAIDPRLRKKL